MTELVKPDWLKIRPPDQEKYEYVKNTLREVNLVTVCEEAKCPNISECWSGGTATFMVMGDTCTRTCKFCNVKTGYGVRPLDPDEPENLAKAINKLNLNYVVITSVDRDDLKDQGSSHFAQCISKIKELIPKLLVEVLIPDFRGDEKLIQKIIDVNPDVIAHNIETVKRLQGKVRDPRANYEQSLGVLDYVKNNSNIFTKSSIMVGFGETKEEVIETMKDLRKIKVDILTLGQYLRPTHRLLSVKEYVSPEQFEYYKESGIKLGFLYVASGPFVRSSYRAGELFIKNVLGRKNEEPLRIKS